MTANITLSLIAAIWLANAALFAAIEPERAMLFARIFVATCQGLARSIGIA